MDNKKYAVAAVGIISFIYLLNFTFGFIEFLPDTIPGFGNMDEAAATMLLLSSLRYFGFDWANLFQKEEAVTNGKNETPIEVLETKINR